MALRFALRAQNRMLLALERTGEVDSFPSPAASRLTLRRSRCGGTRLTSCGRSPKIAFVHLARSLHCRPALEIVGHRLGWDLRGATPTGGRIRRNVRATTLLSHRGTVNSVHSGIDTNRAERFSDPHHHWFQTKCNRMRRVSASESPIDYPPTPQTKAAKNITGRTAVRDQLSATRSDADTHPSLPR